MRVVKQLGMGVLSLESSIDSYEAMAPGGPQRWPPQLRAWDARFWAVTDGPYKGLRAFSSAGNKENRQRAGMLALLLTAFSLSPARRPAERELQHSELLGRLVERARGRLGQRRAGLFEAEEPGLAHEAGPDLAEEPGLADLRAELQEAGELASAEAARARAAAEAAVAAQAQAGSLRQELQEAQFQAQASRQELQEARNSAEAAVAAQAQAESLRQELHTITYYNVIYYNMLQCNYYIVVLCYSILYHSIVYLQEAQSQAESLRQELQELRDSAARAEAPRVLLDIRALLL